MNFSDANRNKVQRFQNYVESTQKAQQERFDALVAELKLTDETHKSILWDIIFNNFGDMQKLEDRINLDIENGLK